MQKDLELWIQTLQTAEEKKEAGVRLRKLMGVALQKKEAAMAVALGGLAARYHVSCQGLFYIFATALLSDGRPFAARAALHTELAHTPSCQRSRDLLQDMESALQGTGLPENAQHTVQCAGNLQFANRHLGQRCFILGNAPSLKNHDLTLLQNEVVISVSNGYLHPHYEVFKPLYHCLPRVPYAETALTPEHVARWIGEMHAHMPGHATLVLSLEETALVQQLSLQRNILPVNFTPSWERATVNAVDLCGPVAAVQSVTIMTLYLALCLGFKEVYLLGIDHDDICTRKYHYFYEKSMNTGLEGGVDAEGNLTDTTYSIVKALNRLFSQYEDIKNVATKRGVFIGNANPLGLLDTFARVRYEELF